MDVINYKPAPTIKAFILDYRPGALFYDWIVGPVGSGKTTGIFFKLCYMASLQAPSPDGIRRTRAVVVRNTMPQLKDTTLVSWGYWFKDGTAGKWHETDKRFVLRFGDVECEVLFRPLDTADDVARVLSLEVTFVIIDEFVQLPRAIIDALSARVGRYPPKSAGGATNWGMWGSSNPDTEDNWWFDQLNNNVVEVERMYIGEDPDVRAMRRRLSGLPEDPTGSIRYFVQPSGFSSDAENLDSLPGGAEYYTNQARNKSEVWIKQFIEAEWGFSIAGTPVIAAFKPAMHVSKRSLRYNPLLPLVVGFDPGLAGSALVFGQQDLEGRLMVLGELVQTNYGSKRLISERLRPYVTRRFPGARLIIAPDPASLNRSQADERPIIAEFAKHYEVKAESNNRLPLRVDSIDHFCTRITDSGVALQIDEKECPTLIRALKGGWRFVMDAKKGTVKGLEPDKGPYSHVGDGFGYLARYFFRMTERELRYSGGDPKKRFVPPRAFGPSYHVR